MMWDSLNFGVSLLTTITGIAIVWGKMVERVKRIEDDVLGLKKVLGRTGNGSSLYITSREHEKDINVLREDIQEIKDMVRQLQLDLQEHARQNTEELQAIQATIGKMQYYLDTHK